MIWDFILAWKDLIIKVFSEYPLSAAIFTLISLISLVMLEHKFRRGKTATNIAAVFVGWAVLVPIFGWIFLIFGKIWSMAETFASFFMVVLGSFYKIYEKHPLVVLVILISAVVAYFIWSWRFSSVVPNRFFRFAILSACVVILSHVLSPIADVVLSFGSSESLKVDSRPLGNVGSKAPAAMNSAGIDSNPPGTGGVKTTPVSSKDATEKQQ